MGVVKLFYDTQEYEYRKKKREYARKYRIQHPNAIKEWRRTHKEHIRAYVRRYTTLNPRDSAKRKVRNHARYIPLNKKCAKCGSNTNLQHHHPDYRNPKLIITLCRDCHYAVHRILSLIMGVLK